MHDRLPPSAWVARFLAGVPAGGRVLDVACGAGRHVALALDRGFVVTGVDRDLGEARRRLGGRPGLELVEADLEDGRPFPFPPGSFDAVVVTNYLWRPLLSAIVSAVKPSGVLIYETFAIGHSRLGRPTNPDFLLRPGELVEASTPALAVIAYEHVRLTGPDRIVARIAAVGPEHGWLVEGAPTAPG